MKKIIGIFASIVMMLSLVGVSAVQASALSQIQINSIIGLIQSFGVDAGTIAKVTASLNGQPTTGTTSSAPAISNNENSGSVSTCVDLKNSMSYGTRDASVNGEVTVLQDFLESNNYLLTSPTGFYGLMTVNAVKSFQAANGISQAGYVGVSTKAKIKSLSCNGATTTVVPQIPTTSTISAPVIISLGSNQGKAGDLITISGSNIINGTTISFQQNNVGVTTQNINYIPTYFIVPNITPGDYTVYLNQYCQSAGCVTSNYMNFTITSPASVVTQTPSITIINPQTGGSVWNGGVGSVENIQWTSTGLQSSGIDITLFDSVTGVGKMIATNIPNTGSYAWKYDSTFITGKYKIMLTPYNKDAPAAGTGYFSITGSPASASQTNAPTITSISPNSFANQASVTIYGTNLTGATAINFNLYSGTQAGSLSPTYISPDGSQLQFIDNGNIFAGFDVTSFQARVVTPSGTSNALSFTELTPKVSSGTINNVTPVTTSASCSSVTINGTSYTLNPCSINVTMVHGSGNKNFSTTIVPSTGGNYGFSVYGSPTGFPSYGLMNNISSGGASGNQNLTFYFNDAYLPVGTYTGYVRIGAWTKNAATDEQDLNLNVNLTVTQ